MAYTLKLLFFISTGDVFPESSEITKNKMIIGKWTNWHEVYFFLYISMIFDPDFKNI